MHICTSPSPPRPGQAPPRSQAPHIIITIITIIIIIIIIIHTVIHIIIIIIIIIIIAEGSPAPLGPNTTVTWLVAIVLTH